MGLGGREGVECCVGVGAKAITVPEGEWVGGWRNRWCGFGT